MNTTDIKTRLYTSAHYNPFFMDGLEIDHIIFYRDGKEIASLNWFGTDNHYIVIYFPFEVKKAAKLNLNRQDAFYMRSKTAWKRCYNLYIHADLTDLKSLGREDYLSDWDRDGSREKFTITIHGEVMYPGIYQYAENETVEDFILQAGGLKETASMVKVDVARRVSNPHALASDSIIAENFSFALKDGFVVDGEPGFTLMPFDEVYVRKSPGYYKQQNVIVEGEVVFAGTYTLSKKDLRLSDLIRAAGGVNDRAFTQGAKLERRYTQEERQRAEAVLKKTREDLEASMQEQAARTGNANLANLSNTEQLKKYQEAIADLTQYNNRKKDNNALYLIGYCYFLMPDMGMESSLCETFMRACMS